MPSTQIQVVKWSFPAFALIIGLLWYKRRRVDRADPGGISKSSESAEKKRGVRESSQVVGTTSHPSLLCDSGIHIDESFSSQITEARQSPLVNDQTTCKSSAVASCSPRKVSESLDIVTRRSSSSHVFSMQSAVDLSSSGDSQSWYKDIEPIPKMLDIQLGSNPKISDFEMIARNRSGTSFVTSSSRDAEEVEKVIKVYESNGSVAQLASQQQRQLKLTQEKSKGDEEEVSGECSCVEDSEQQQAVAQENQSGDDKVVEVQTQTLSERDSANHSPVSGVLEGSVTDEARSEGSTDSGKGGSINGHAKDSSIPMTYEFNIPPHLVGRLIGRHGSFLQSIRNKVNVNIVVKRHPTSAEQNICTIEGSMDGINVALELIRQKFPEKKYPQITLEQISPMKISEEIPWVSEMMCLSLIEGVNNDIVVCHIVKPNRLFVQLPTHPTYPSLRILEDNMTLLYDTTESPPVPDELNKGMILVAKWYNRWVRVYVETPDPHGERNLVRLLDHGGFWTFSNASMRKTRVDYLTLPFQAIEIFLANIQPTGGEWTQEAYDVAYQMCSGTVAQAQIEGYINNNTYVNLYLNIHKHGVISLADELIARGFAEPISLEGIVPEDVPVI